MSTKNQHLSSVLIVIGYLLTVLGLILIIPLLMALMRNEGRIIYLAFIIPAVSSLTLGFVIEMIFRKKTLNLNIVSSMIVVTFAWLAASLVGSIPFIIGLNVSIIDAVFEAVSGFTTTGITVFEGLDAFPKSIILWRSMMQWLGGLGILTFFLLITFRSEGNLWQLFSAESHKINISRPVPNIYKTIKIFWGIYLLFTLLEIILLYIFQVPLFEAVIHSLTTLSTGGFSNHDLSIAYYRESGHPYYRQIEYIITLFMLLGGINFLVHFRALTGNVKEYFSNMEMKYFWRIIFYFSLIIFIGRYLISPEILGSLEENFRTIIFQVVSIMTTTGFVTENITGSFFPAVARQLFLGLMLIGGCVGSTSGGIKVMRIAVLNHLFFREMRKIYLPSRAVTPVSIDGQLIDVDEVMKIAALFFGWILLILIGAIITALFSDLNGYQSFSGMFSAVGNVGPFFFSVEKMVSLSPVIKITYIIGMLAGRLEILPIFLLLSKRLWKYS
ncbi:MAG: TrkH family potassium uptake protein [Halanaerobiales bacterium]